MCSVNDQQEIRRESSAMKTIEKLKEFKIMVLEDSEFFNSVLTRTISNYLEILSQEKGFEYDVQSFTTVKDFLRNLKEDTDIVFIDYYLGGGLTAPEVISWMKKICDGCKIIVVSQSNDGSLKQKVYSEGAAEFITKSKESLFRACIVLEEIIYEKANGVNDKGK